MMTNRKERPSSVTMTLNEGLRRNDLKNLISNVISIDEYNSKIDDTAIVIAFRVKDRQAAQDLNRFIQKSYVDLLDTDISPAPDLKGYYLVFVELPLNDKIADSIEIVVKEISDLCDIKEWKMSLRTVDEVVDFNTKMISRVLDEELNSQLHEYFHMSDLNNVIVEGAALSLVGSKESYNFVIRGFGSRDRVLQDHKLVNEAVAIAGGGSWQARKLKMLLGPSWDVEQLGECVVIQHSELVKILLLQAR
jgi:hypothetical protein